MKIFLRNTTVAAALGITSLLQANAQKPSKEVVESKQYVVETTAKSDATANSRDDAPGEPGLAAPGPRLNVKSDRRRNGATQSEDVLVQQAEDDRLLHQLLPNHNGFFAGMAGPGEPRGSLVIRTSKPDPKDEGMEEDLVVMQRILEKTIARNSDENGQRRAMGIPLFALAGSATPHSLYLEGYGALFLLETEIPLLPPVAKSESVKPRESDSTWEETKQEIYGDDSQYRMAPKYRIGQEPSEPYDAAKVEDLKDSILKALANANNIHGLNDERVVVVVTNRIRRESKDRFRSMAFADATTVTPVKASSVEPKTVYTRKHRASDTAEKADGKMTISVKKSDIEQFAKKSIEFQDFKKKATITIY